MSEERVLNFDEAMTRARAAHTITRVCHQPGNDYRKEYICKCGAFVFATNWKQHVLDAADQILVPPTNPEHDLTEPSDQRKETTC